MEVFNNFIQYPVQNTSYANRNAEKETSKNRKKTAAIAATAVVGLAGITTAAYLLYRGHLNINKVKKLPKNKPEIERNIPENLPENLPGKTDEVKDTIKNIPEATSKEPAAKNGQDAVETAVDNADINSKNTEIHKDKLPDADESENIAKEINAAAQETPTATKTLYTTEDLFNFIQKSDDEFYSTTHSAEEVIKYEKKRSLLIRLNNIYKETNGKNQISNDNKELTETIETIKNSNDIDKLLENEDVLNDIVQYLYKEPVGYKQKNAAINRLFENEFIPKASYAEFFTRKNNKIYINLNEFAKSVPIEKNIFEEMEGIEGLRNIQNGAEFNGWTKIDDLKTLKQLFEESKEITLKDDLTKMPLVINGYYVLPERLAIAFNNTREATGKAHIVENIPEIFKGLDEDVVLKDLDNLSALLRKTNAFPNLKFSTEIGGKEILVEMAGNGNTGMVVKLSDKFNNKVAMKTWCRVCDIGSQGGMGENAIHMSASRAGVCDIPQYYMSNLVRKNSFGEWSVVEFIEKDKPVRSGGLKMEEWMEQNRLKNCDFNDGTYLGDYLVDFGGIMIPENTMVKSHVSISMFLRGYEKDKPMTTKEALDFLTNELNLDYINDKARKIMDE